MIATNLAHFLACVTCMSSRGEAVTNAASGAILFMLLLLVIVFGGVAKFMRYLSRCEKDAIAAARGQ